MFLTKTSVVIGRQVYETHVESLLQIQLVFFTFLLNLLLIYVSLDFNSIPLIVQIIIWLVLQKFKGSSGANYAKNFLRAAILVQYIPRLYRILPMLAGQSASGFIFESAWANFVINLLTFVLSGHVVGSCWYLFGLQVR